VHVVSVPVNMQHMARQENAAVNITFSAPHETLPIPLAVPGVFGAILLGGILYTISKRGEK
jgi:hypothetical protein